IAIIYEDNSIVVVSKPPGMVTHPSYGHYNDTLVNALLFHIKDLSDISGEKRPGIVHRLDKDTSGLIVIAKNNKAHQKLSNDLKNRKIKKNYLALVKGRIKENKGTIKVPIKRSQKDRKRMAVGLKSSKEAVTLFEVLDRFEQFTFVRITLVTGRTHQIRVHFAYIKHPIAGDAVYGGKSAKNIKLKRQFLHASRIELEHPETGKAMVFKDNLPHDLNEVLMSLKGV
ncbi:MAG: RluA family pseudouridine synthase, partial [Actinomycetia bacterium]|nr:RluA family pseudouridine synthase [Actinomycetes bacterium]